MHGEAAGGMPEEMASMVGMLDGKTGDAFDQAFLTEMTRHHEGAVVMAELARRSAKHQEIKDLAERIVEAQNREIGDMRRWQQAWYPPGEAQ